MKKLVLFAFAYIFASSALAEISANSSWEEIFAARGPYKIYAPAIYMGRAIDFTFACRDGDQLRTMKPVDLVETRGSNHRTDLVVTGQEYLSTPIHYKTKESFCDETRHKTVCTDRVIEGNYPLSAKLRVVRRMRAREKFLFAKTYNIPDCEAPQPE